MNTYWLKKIRKRFSIIPDDSTVFQSYMVLDHKNKIGYQVNVEKLYHHYDGVDTIAGYIVVVLLNGRARWGQHAAKLKERRNLRAYEMACIKYDLQHDIKKR